MERENKRKLKFKVRYIQQRFVFVLILSIRVHKASTVSPISFDTFYQISFYIIWVKTFYHTVNCSTKMESFLRNDRLVAKDMTIRSLPKPAYY